MKMAMFFWLLLYMSLSYGAQVPDTDTTSLERDSQVLWRPNQKLYYCAASVHPWSDSEPHYLQCSNQTKDSNIARNLLLVLDHVCRVCVLVSIWVQCGSCVMHLCLLPSVYALCNMKHYSAKPLEPQVHWAVLHLQYYYCNKLLKNINTSLAKCQRSSHKNTSMWCPAVSRAIQQCHVSSLQHAQIPYSG